MTQSATSSNHYSSVCLPNYLFVQVLPSFHFQYFYKVMVSNWMLAHQNLYSIIKEIKNWSMIANLPVWTIIGDWPVERQQLSLIDLIKHSIISCWMQHNLVQSIFGLYCLIFCATTLVIMTSYRGLRSRSLFSYSTSFFQMQIYFFMPLNWLIAVCFEHLA